MKSNFSGSHWVTVLALACSLSKQIQQLGANNSGTPSPSLPFSFSTLAHQKQESQGPSEKAQNTWGRSFSLQQENVWNIAKDEGCFALEEGGQRGKKLQEAAVLQTLIGIYKSLELMQASRCRSGEQWKTCWRGWWSNLAATVPTGSH